MRAQSNENCADQTQGIATKVKFNKRTVGENTSQENYFRLDSESGTCHVNVPNNFQSRKKLPKYTWPISISAAVILILLVLCGLVYWTTRYQKAPDEKHDVTASEFNANSNVESGNSGGVDRQSNQIKFLKQKFLHYLHHISGSNTISGLFVDNAGTSSKKGIDIVYKIAGVHPGIICTQMPKYSESASNWTTFIEEIIYNWNNHHLVRIDWFWSENPLSAMPVFTDRDDSENRWGDLVKEGGQLNLIWKGQLDLIVPYLKQLETAGVITIIDILPVMNDKTWKWTLWSGRPGVNATAKLYKFTHDYLTKHHNLNSLIWTWSLLYDQMTDIEKFWPGSEYVDVASVHMWGSKGLSNAEYQKLLNSVGDKPVSMERIWTVPTPQLLAAQPRWIWFTADDDDLDVIRYNVARNVNATFNSASVINRGSIDYFNDAK